MMFSRAYDDIFLNDFNIVHWDQRFSGKSFDSSIPAETFNLNQIANDGLKVVEKIKEELDCSKIILVGHSWGTMVSSEMVLLSPENFSAYLSVGTVGNLPRSNVLKYEHLKKSIAEKGTEEDKSLFEQLGHPPWPRVEDLRLLSPLMDKYGGMLYSLNKDDLFRAAEKSTDYTESDFMNMDKGQEIIWKQIAPIFETYEAVSHYPSLTVSTYFCIGKYDMATPTNLAREYFDNFNSPKGKYWVEFKKSAHFPMYEEPESFLRVMRKVVEKE